VREVDCATRFVRATPEQKVTARGAPSEGRRTVPTMRTVRGRLARVLRFGRVTAGLIVSSVALVTAVAYWETRLGYRGIVVVAAVALLALLGIVALPERAWGRITGVDTLTAELGAVHAEGAQLRANMPWVMNTDPTLVPWTTAVYAWDDRVQALLADTHWLGTYLSPVSGFKTTTDSHETASAYRNALDDRLERLGQIIAAQGKRA